MNYFTSFLLKYTTPILVIAIGIISVKVLGFILRKSLEKSKVDKALHKFIINSSKLILAIIVLIMFLDSINVDTKSIVTVLGISGGAIAFALKDSLSNIAGGILILITKPFLNGDFVDINGVSGTIKQIDMILTTMITSDKKIVTIPNGIISSGIVTNYTRSGIRRVDIAFSIFHAEDIDAAKRTAEAVALENKYILKDREIIAVITGNSRGMINLELKAWCNTDEFWEAKYSLEEKVIESLSEKGYTMEDKLVVRLESSEL